MSPLLKRILVNGTLTAATLAVVGVGYAELAGLFLAAKAPTRASIEAPLAEDTHGLADSLYTRVPATMALWGFLFVAAGEVVLDRVRKKKPAPVADPKPDTALLLLEEILAKVEAERATVAANPSPSPPPAENTPVAS
ncbi:MAG: hypothetical protein U0791_03890 [Gemmataceae bacterium]